MDFLIVEFKLGTTDGQIKDVVELLRLNEPSVAAVRALKENTAALSFPLKKPRPSKAPGVQHTPETMTGIEQLELTIRVRNCLKSDNIYTVEELCTMTERQLLKIPNLQRKGVNEIKEVLQSRGLYLAEEQPRGTPLEILELSVRASNCLKSENISTIEQLAGMTVQELRKIPNLGKWSLKDIQGALARHNLCLKAA